MSAKKPFNELTQAGQKKRIAAIEKRRQKYGTVQGLFRVTRVSDHGTSMVNGKQGKHEVHRFGYNVVPVKDVPETDFAPNEFAWVNQMIDTKSAKSKGLIKAMQELKDDLAADNGVNSVLVSIEYKKNGQYTNVNSLWRRDKKGKAKANPAVAEDLPY